MKIIVKAWISLSVSAISLMKNAVPENSLHQSSTLIQMQRVEIAASTLKEDKTLGDVMFVM